ncbi:hypothetical protein H5410_056575 [Solanum commersonii]|uniref:DNA-directed DNA polymerase n=1 Tax=Solanum commersonii TaxID=4109 RepID=A0A9J5WKL2_SOLCO|nr:hypothetical protein H5410_056575 [Solanum commersonii]
MNISNDQIARLIAESVVSDEVYDRIAVRKIENHKPKYLKHIIRLKPNCKERRSFIVSVTETILAESDTDQIEKVHMPYVVVFVVVKPSSAPSKEQVGSIKTYFSEDYPDILLLGGVMHRAQEIYYSLFQIDLVKKMTLLSLALDIFCTFYYDKKDGLSIYPIGMKIHSFAVSTTAAIAIHAYLTAKNYITMMIKAKKDGNDSLAFVYKILMNSLYDRFGINPGTTVIEMFTHEFYIVTYKTNAERGPDTEWNPPKIS